MFLPSIIYLCKHKILTFKIKLFPMKISSYFNIKADGSNGKMILNRNYSKHKERLRKMKA